MGLAREQRFGGAAIPVLLLLPVVVLLLTGLYLLRQDKNSVEREARKATEASARSLLRRFAAARTNTPLSPGFGLTNTWPEGVALIQVSSDGALVFPPPLRTAPADFFATLSGSNSDIWINAERAEYQTNDLAAALQLWDELLGSELPASALPAARFQKAVMLERLGRNAEALTALRSLSEGDAAARLRSGIPVAVLATLKLLRSTDMDENERRRLGERAVNLLLENPTEFTPELLLAGRESSARAAFDYASQIWEQHQLGRELFRQIAQNPTNEWLSLAPGDEPWRVYRLGTNLLARSFANLSGLAAETLQEISPPLPSFVSASLGDACRIIYNTPLLSSSGPVWQLVTSGNEPLLACEVRLTDESVLFARQRQRARVFGGLLAAAALSAVVGALQAQRSLTKQQRLNEMKSNFVSSVSHELRAPLGSVRLISEALQSGRVHDPEKQREYFDFLVQESRRLSALIENVLEFSRIEQNRRSLQFETMDLRSTCEAAVKSVAPLAAERDIRIARVAPDSACTVTGDSLALERSVVNLLDNALKHSPREETVILALKARPDGFDISVKDNGPGIHASEHTRIFERFYRVGSELRRETPGVGIGLSIVQDTVQAHGGTITVESEPGRGATFTIFLPHA